MEVAVHKRSVEKLHSPKALNGSAFALDALRIEVSGSTSLHPTTVDLPGLISVSNEKQSDEDMLTFLSRHTMAT
jgi:hypothetical protein